MQQIIGWIKATRNLTAHGKYEPSPVEALTALRATLELLDALRPADKAVLCMECPSGEITKVELQRGSARWLKELAIVCHEAAQQDREGSEEKQTKIKTRLDHKLLEQHYKLAEQGRCGARRAQRGEKREQEGERWHGTVTSSL